jgi:hypothetical protein
VQQQEIFLNSLHSFFPLAAALVGYLIGSLSFAVIVSSAMGLNAASAVMLTMRLTP